MLAALGKMTDANQKEMLAGLFLSKFDTKESKAGLERLGYDTFQDAYKGLAELVGGNPLSVRNYRDEFNPAFPNGRWPASVRRSPHGALNTHPASRAAFRTESRFRRIPTTGANRTDCGIRPYETAK